MEAYGALAQVYDIFMEDVDYDMWLDYLRQIWQRYGVSPVRVTDLGCGTGSMTLRLAKAGYDVTGIDISEEMLALAEQKCRMQGCEAALYCQDMCDFSLPQAQDCIISLMDCMNYLTEAAELSAAFACVANALTSEGLLIFDLNTEYRFREIYGSNTFAYTTEDAAYIWENFYDTQEKINEYAVNIFQKKEKDGTYTRTEEFHYEKAYTTKEVEKLLTQNGLELLECFAAYGFLPPEEETERIFYVARKRKTEV